MPPITQITNTLDAIQARADGTSPASLWKEDIGVYEDPMDDDDLAFCRGPMHNRKGGAVEPWKEAARRDSRFVKGSRLDIPNLVAALRVAVEALNRSQDFIDSLRDIQVDNEYLEESRKIDEALTAIAEKLSRTTP